MEDLREPTHHRRLRCGRGLRARRRRRAGLGAGVAARDRGDGQQTTAKSKLDDRPDAREAKRRELRKEAVEQVATGKAKPQNRGGSQAVKVGKKQWVEYGTQQKAQILSFLVNFGDTKDSRFPTAPAGPTSGQIPQPDRSEDNSTYWKANFDRQHYLDMFFNGMPEQNGESFHGVYKEMSSGRFDVEGDVSNWVTVPNNEASYGQTESNTDMTRFIDDSGEAWLKDQQAAGQDAGREIKAYLQSFDVWDRYDHDGDGDFNEPDGYIDHFQAIHAGTGEEAGAPEWAIWSHRWAANPGRLAGPGGRQVRWCRDRRHRHLAA